MIVDSSALVAIALQEDGYEHLFAKLTAPGANAGVGAPTLVEAGVVLATRLGSDGRLIVRTLVETLRIDEIPFVEAHWPLAIDAYARFGRGNHAARLNFGDCLSYAVARLSDQPLLFVGKDFDKTDIRIA